MQEDRMTQFKYQEVTKKDWARKIIYIAVFTIIIAMGAIFLLSKFLYLWLILVAISLFLLVRWHAKNTAYRCSKCRHEFEISTFKDFISPHGPSKSGGWKYLKCPKCHERSKATVLRKTKR